MDNELIKEREEFWKLQYKKIEEKAKSIPPIKKHEYQEIKDDVRLVYELLEEKHPKKFSERLENEKGEENYVMTLAKEQIFVRIIKHTDKDIYLRKGFSHKKYSLDNLRYSVWFRDLIKDCERFNLRNANKFSQQDLEDICVDAYYILQKSSPPPPLQYELGYFIRKKIAPRLLNDQRNVKITNKTPLENLSPEEEAKRNDLIAFYEVETVAYKERQMKLMSIVWEAIGQLPKKKQRFIELLTNNASKEETAKELEILPKSVNDFAYDTRRKLVEKIENKGIEIESLKKFFYNENR